MTLTRKTPPGDREATRFFICAANYLGSIPDTLAFDAAEPVRDVAEVLVRITPATIRDREVGVEAMLEVRLQDIQHVSAPQGYWLRNTHCLFPLPGVRFEDLEVAPWYGGQPPLARPGDARSSVTGSLTRWASRLRRGVQDSRRSGLPLRIPDLNLQTSEELASLLDAARRLIKSDGLAEATRGGGER